MMKRERSSHLFEEAQSYLPGGVNSPVRAFGAVGGHPLFIKRGQGARIYDEDGSEFIDYVCSWGPLILGHAHPKVVEALKQAIEQGASFGAPTELETTLAQMICDALPSIQMVRFVNSGTEATMSALRLARAFTGRNRILKFAGCYHGHHDSLLAQAGSGLATFGILNSPGVPPSYTRETLVAPYNDLESVERIFENHAGEIAAVIVEPIAANMGVVSPKSGFLQGLRQVTEENGSLLIFDEVITGFRAAYGGAQSIYGVVPDLTCLGKIIGGGLPVGAYGGKREIMEMVAPKGQVYQAGTLSGNPLAMTAGRETLKILSVPDTYVQLEERSSHLADSLSRAAAKAGVPVFISRVGSILTVFFTNGEVVDYESALSSDVDLYARFFHGMLAEGIYLPPSQFEAIFVSLAHSQKDIELTARAAEQTLPNCHQKGSNM